MKIVNRKEFLELPDGTLYAKYAPCYTEGLEIKGQTLETDDWIHLSLDLPLVDDLFEFTTKMEHGESVPFDSDNYGRDGCFDTDQLFLVWSKKDVQSLINILKDS